MLQLFCQEEFLRRLAVSRYIVPKPIEREIPTQLDGFSAPVVLTYSLDSIVAEKLDTIIARMNMNSSMKDFYNCKGIAVRFAP